MQLPLYQIDAFASQVFRGNPAAVCPLESWLEDDVMQSIAAENQLSETAFFVREGDAFRLRWFTPTDEVDLCGHATLASAHVLFEELGYEGDELRFDTQSGRLVVSRDGPRLVLDFPVRRATKVDAAPGLIAALGAPQPVEVHEGPYWLVVYEDEAAVRALAPDFGALASFEPVIATAAGASDGVDFVSRFFAPNCGVDEDPVTGSAHCTSTPYWAERLGKSRLVARQISARGGELHCELRGDRVAIAGNAVLYLRGTITI